ncbi:unnamed protein product [Choristocarpus tenellus]
MKRLSFTVLLSPLVCLVKLLALLKAKQAQAKAHKVSVGPSLSSSGANNVTPVGERVPPLNVQVKKSPTSTKAGGATVTGSLQGLLGGDNESESDGEDDVSKQAVGMVARGGEEESTEITYGAVSDHPASDAGQPSGLPDGFFDDDIDAGEEEVGKGELTGREALSGGYGQAISTQSVQAEGPVSSVVTGNVDKEDTALDESNPTNGSALPEGFFDDPEVDAKSRGVDLKTKKKEEELNEWREFQSFAEEVRLTEKEEKQQEEAAEEDKEQYEELEQATMMGRLATLMQKSESIARKRKHSAGERGGHGEGKGGGSGKVNGCEDGEGREAEGIEGTERSVMETGSAMRAVAVASAPVDHAAVEISAMLYKRRRERKRELDEAFSGEYVPMNPLDWRAKGV